MRTPRPESRQYFTNLLDFLVFYTTLFLIKLHIKKIHSDSYIRINIHYFTFLAASSFNTSSRILLLSSLSSPIVCLTLTSFPPYLYKYFKFANNLPIATVHITCLSSRSSVSAINANNNEANASLLS